MHTTNVVGYVALVAGVSVAIVGVALASRGQAIAWLGVLVGAALMRLAYSLLRPARQASVERR